LLVGCSLSAGCNAIFGIQGGVATGGTGGICSIYDGKGSLSFTDVGAANLPSQTVGTDGSVMASYISGLEYTSINMSGPGSSVCGVTLEIDLSGMPQVGDYPVVAMSPIQDLGFGQGSRKAYLFAGGSMDADGGCGVELAFQSMAGSGTVSVTSVEGQRIQFTVTGVQATGINDPTCADMGGPCAGQGTIQIDVKGGEADCLTME
jgi:hypothetical protein